MGETEDPRAALGDKSVAVRAAAARDLSLVGDYADLPPLVEMAVQAPSSALRLYAAAAAADILHRHRGLPGHPTLSAEQRREVLTWATSYDPGRNPGLLMMLSAVPDETSRSRLLRMLRDPRNGVRAGAAMALRRMAISAAAMEEGGVAETVAEALADGRTPPDASLELIKMVGEVGWQELREAASRAGGQGRVHAEAAEEALRRLDARRELAGWDGLYLSDGLDVFEPGAPGEVQVRLVAGGRTAGEHETPRDLTVADGLAHVEGTEAPARLVWASRIGRPAEEISAALQQAGRTWWRIAGKELPATVEQHLGRFSETAAPLLAGPAAWLAEIEGAVAPRVRAIATYLSGDVEGAGALLEEQVGGKRKPRADVWYWLARVRLDRGEKKPALEALETFLSTAPKAAKLRDEATALRAKLSK